MARGDGNTHSALSIARQVFDEDGKFLYVNQEDETIRDSFGRTRVSNPVTLFDSKQIFDNAPLFWDDQQVSGGSTTSTYTKARASTEIAVAATTAGKRVRQTFQRFNYQPGKSLLVLMTARVASGGGAGIKMCVGYFDDDNGVFFGSEDGVLHLTQRSSSTGSAVDTTITQANWNGDKLDGSGKSGITLDPTMAQILWADFEWLGVGDVRMGFVIDSNFIVCHTFHNANAIPSVYMSLANLPVRYSVENDGTGVASSVEHICSTVISEGGSDDLGRLNYASNGGTHVDANVENTIYALVGIRLKSTHLAETIKIVNMSILESTGAKDYEWLLLFNPTVAGTFTYGDETNSAIQSAKGATANTVTGGTAITGSYASSAQRGGASGSGINNALKLGSAIDGTQDEIVLCIRPVGGATNIDASGSISFRELS